MPGCRLPHVPATALTSVIVITARRAESRHTSMIAIRALVAARVIRAVALHSSNTVAWRLMSHSLKESDL